MPPPRAPGTLRLCAGSQPVREPWCFLSTPQTHTIHHTRVSSGSSRVYRHIPAPSSGAGLSLPSFSPAETHTMRGTSHPQHSAGLLWGVGGSYFFPETRLKILLARLDPYVFVIIYEQIDIDAPQHQICLQGCCQELWVLRKKQDRQHHLLWPQEVTPLGTPQPSVVLVAPVMFDGFEVA